MLHCVSAVSGNAVKVIQDYRSLFLAPLGLEIPSRARARARARKRKATTYKC